MADQHEAPELLTLAQDDYVAAGALLDDVAAVSDANVGFHARQAVEKAVKPVLAGRDAECRFRSRTTSAS